MSLGLTKGQMKRFLALPEAERAGMLAEMSVPDLLAFDADFETWAHEGQWPPAGEGWRVWLMMAGRGFGKTRAGAEWVHRLAMGQKRRIALAGRRESRLFVLADASVAGASPERWARCVAGAAAEWGASHVVAEANQGGAMVKSVLEAADAGLRVKLVHASKGKVARAEPVATRFEAGRAFLAGTFPELEAELAGLTVGGGYEGPGRSPDRADAMVWALTELGETRSGVPRVRML